MSSPTHTPRRHYPLMAAAAGRVEPAPRRVRGLLNGRIVFDTTRARYVWEWPNYPQYYIPLDDVAQQYLVDEEHEQKFPRGTARRHGLQVGEEHRRAAARVYGVEATPGVAGSVRFEFQALDAWFEEDEEIFVHPRNPYTRVDAIRSHRLVRVELDGLVLAETHSPVLLFETGLPTRHYIDRTDVHFEHLVASASRTQCPYKGSTSHYWSVRANGELNDDLAWAYDFPTPAVAAIAGMVAFYDEKVDTFIDGTLQTRPASPFFGQ